MNRYAASVLVCALALAAASASRAEQAPTLDKVRSSGVMTVAYRESSIPFSYLDGDARPTGFGWEICQRVVEQVKRATGRADLKVAAQAVTSQNRIPLIVNGTIDIECGSTTNNSERAKQVAFAVNYFYTGTRLLVKAGSPVRGFADLKGRKVVSTTGTTNVRASSMSSAMQASSCWGPRTMPSRRCWCSRTAPTPSAWTTSCCSGCALARRSRRSWRSWVSRCR